MGCTVKDALLKDYRDFTAGYVRAIKRMKHGGSKMPQSDFSALRDLAKDCEKKAEAAKRQLQRHMSEHRC
jgi:hypothetical protein